MGLKSLAEAVILQSMEDLWYPAQRDESRKFFREDGFKIYAKIAGLNPEDMVHISFISLGGEAYGRTTALHK